VWLEGLDKFEKYPVTWWGSNSRLFGLWHSASTNYATAYPPYYSLWEVNRSECDILFLFLLWPPLLCSGQSSWLQIRRSGFYSRLYHIFWDVVVLERGPHCLANATEELLGRTGLETLEYGRGDPSRLPRDTLYPQKSALTSSTNWKSLGRHSSLSDSGDGFFLFLFLFPLIETHPKHISVMWRLSSKERQT
jgi:hypothetical protein